MPAHVPDSRLRGRVRAEKRHGHAKGGNETWRTYETTTAKRLAKAATPPAESWWLGLNREAFQEALAKRVQPDDPVGPHWHTSTQRGPNG